MTIGSTPALLDCEALAACLGTAGSVVLDATFFLPNQGRDAAAEFRAAHLPGAQFFDIDAVADRRSALPHMLPQPAEFAAAVGALGIGNGTHVVLYDANSFMASARAWWMFRVFGHDRVSVLDGGLAAWRARGHSEQSAPALPRAACRFEAAYRPELVRDLEAMRLLVNGAGVQIVDARSPGRFTGSEPEPRAGLRFGHLPGSRNLFFKWLIDSETGCMKAESELASAFRSAGLDLREPLVTTCGTGVTAAILALALYRLGRVDVPVYDGSWTEWGGRADTPIATGP
ncbi:3-mercaptopyruvate sulfurtransferase [Methylotetracoccus oryzae]|uniref:3-mercaptopyruvate sulfurtransferase n=1 Tax=Methylotetracoccus oryzae TaxID=1919059 RepID=UPI0011183206|nr:3-mercaptopyruvate sulfurtransferase [Methylotetracoccus oryzae]